VNHVRSRDGTRIAYDRLGAGPPVILVDGAFCTRSFGPMPKLAPLLAPHFTVFLYDRRGRGDSGDTAPYAGHPQTTKRGSPGWSPRVAVATPSSFT